MSSRLPDLADPPADLDGAIDAFAASAPGLPLAVAFSGGADSTALLLACAARWPGQVQAWHVHHGLQTVADDFERHCAQLCQRLGVPLSVARIDARAGPGQSPEDAARRGRYQALDRLARQAGIATVVLGQHADDQVETVVLALTRGAGLPGLAAMPLHWQRQGVQFRRPLLGVPAPAIRTWLQVRGERWIEDPSNDDVRYTRNRIRARLLPVMEENFPQFRATFGRSARHAAQAQEILAEVAAQDLAACGVPPRLAALRMFSLPRRANLLRHWLAVEHGQVPGSAQLAALQAQIQACTTRGHRIDIRVGQGRVRRRGEAIDWEAEPGPPERPPAAR